MLPTISLRSTLPFELACRKRRATVGQTDNTLLNYVIPPLCYSSVCVCTEQSALVTNLEQNIRTIRVNASFCNTEDIALDNKVPSSTETSTCYRGSRVNNCSQPITKPQTLSHTPFMSIFQITSKNQPEHCYNLALPCLPPRAPPSLRTSRLTDSITSRKTSFFLYLMPSERQ